MSSINAFREPRTFYPIYTISDAGHALIDSDHTVIDSGHAFIDSGDTVIDGIRDLQKLRRGHSSLFLRQSVQPLQRIIDVVISNQFLD